MITLDMLDQIRFDVLKNLGPTNTEFSAVVGYRQFCELRLEKHNDTRSGWYPNSDPPGRMRWGPWTITGTNAGVSYVELRRDGVLYATLQLPTDVTSHPWSSL